MIESFFHRRKAKAENLDALQAEIARQLRGQLDLPWPLPPDIEDLLEELHFQELHALDTRRSS